MGHASGYARSAGSAWRSRVGQTGPVSVTSDVRVLVGTPCTQGGVTQQYLTSVLALQRRFDQLGWSLDVQTRADGLVTRTRNLFGSDMVRTDAFTHLLMADADIGFEPSVVERLVRSGHDVVGACVPFREARWSRVREAVDVAPDLLPEELESMAHRYAVSFEAPQPRAVVRAEDGFLPARFVGGALLLARRDVFVQLSHSEVVDRYESAGPRSLGPTDGWTFFDPLVDPATDFYLSEDYAFCYRWREIGGTVWADVLSRVTHNGTVTVRGDIALTLRTAARLATKSQATGDAGHSPDP